ANSLRTATAQEAPTLTECAASSCRSGPTSAGQKPETISDELVADCIQRHELTTQTAEWRQWVHNTKQSIAILNEQVKKTRLELQSDPTRRPTSFCTTLVHSWSAWKSRRSSCPATWLRAACRPPPELFQRGSQGEVTDLELKKAIVARYVSLVPFVSDRVGISWRREEHAVLLANYLTHLTSGGADTQIYLALGNAVPEGATAYVIEMNWQRKVCLERIDRAQSDRSTLVSIDCLINSDGVYINRKPRSTTELMRCWHREIGNIEYDIELAVRKEIESLRARVPTLWYNGGAKDVRELLKALETYHYDPNNQAIATAKEAHNRMFGSKVIVGYPLQMSYKSTKEILNDVRNTKLHGDWHVRGLQEHGAKVQFSCVVYVHQYPKNTLPGCCCCKAAPMSNAKTPAGRRRVHRACASKSPGLRAGGLQTVGIVAAGRRRYTRGLAPRAASATVRLDCAWLLLLPLPARWAAPDLASDRDGHTDASSRALNGQTEAWRSWLSC
uniref:NADAR domain-containing protein n=1 Tax=Macrostomum lignano TaxID=282301 RepID=A0A1I8FBQ6_9PLAT